MRPVNNKYQGPGSTSRNATVDLQFPIIPLLGVGAGHDWTFGVGSGIGGVPIRDRAGGRANLRPQSGHLRSLACRIDLPETGHSQSWVRPQI
jgi:hypothetical protein